MSSSSIRPDQLRAIHAQRRELGIDEETYRGILEDAFSKRSSKDLTAMEAAKLLDHFNHLADRIGLPTRKPRAMKYDELADRPQTFASPRQLRMIEAMWAEVSRKTTAAERARALSSFLYRIVDCSHITMLRRDQVRKVIKALEAMKKAPPTLTDGDQDGSSNEEASEVGSGRSRGQGDERRSEGPQ